MKDFWVDFSGSFLVMDCEDEKEAEARFWGLLNSYNKSHEGSSFNFCEIDLIEEADHS